MPITRRRLLAAAGSAAFVPAAARAAADQSVMSSRVVDWTALTAEMTAYGMTRVKVVKNKVAPPFREAEFEIMYGTGISREGEIIDLGSLHNIIEKSGSWYSYNGQRIGQGKDNTRTYLQQNPQLTAEIEGKIRERLMDVETQRLEADLDAGLVPVVAGFQGVDEEGDITTIGRGGSDTTAVALAVALRADECQILTDVDGVYTTDPRMVPQARRLERVTFDEMLELAGQGSRVLHLRSVEFASKYNVPLRVASSFAPGPGTLICREEPRVEAPVVSGIAFNRDEAEITVAGVPDVPGTAHCLLRPVSDANIEVDMIVLNAPCDGKVDLTFTVHRDDYAVVLKLVTAAAANFHGASVSGNNSVAKLSVVGVGMRSHAGVATRLFETLAREQINVRLVSTSEIKISVLVDEPALERSVRSLHTAFELDQQESA